MTAVSGRAGLVHVDKYLLPNEEQVATVRRHPAVLIGPAAVALAGLLAAGVLSATVASSSRPALYVIWGLELILVLRLGWKAWNWAADYFIVTSARLMLTSGVFTRTVAMVPLTKITDFSFQRSFSGRMLGFGEFIVESAGQHQALSHIDHIPYPEHLYLLVCGMLFPESNDKPDSGDDGKDFGEDDNPAPDDPPEGPQAGTWSSYDGNDNSYANPADGPGDSGYEAQPGTKPMPSVVVQGDPIRLSRSRRAPRPIRRGRRDPNDEL